jgi:hypothetical protein
MRMQLKYSVRVCKLQQTFRLGEHDVEDRP